MWNMNWEVAYERWRLIGSLPSLSQECQLTANHRRCIEGCLTGERNVPQVVSEPSSYTNNVIMNYNISYANIFIVHTTHMSNDCGLIKRIAIEITPWFQIQTYIRLYWMHHSYFAFHSRVFTLKKGVKTVLTNICFQESYDTFSTRFSRVFHAWKQPFQ